MTADALATAAMVLGPVAGLQLIEDEPQAEAFFVVRDSNRFITTQTSGFASKAKAD
jgi:thiamine biosynthesis lipoprotein ApbE